MAQYEDRASTTDPFCLTREICIVRKTPPPVSCLQASRYVRSLIIEKRTYAGGTIAHSCRVLACEIDLHMALAAQSFRPLCGNSRQIALWRLD
jgi:hypothetical protein